VDSGTSGLIERTLHDGVWRLTLARPPVNAVDLELARAFERELSEARESAACRAVVVAAKGRAFCGGIDIKALPAYDAATREEFLRTITRAIAALYTLPKPVVAALRGHALGAGLVLALACELRVAAAGDYQLGLSEISAGVPFPAGAMIVVKAELSGELARKLVMTGEAFAPSHAHAAEIFDAIVPPEKLLGTANERALRGAGQRSYAAVKEQLRREASEALRAAVNARDPLLDTGWL
jgi:enoyl-CoA hydratase